MIIQNEEKTTMVYQLKKGGEIKFEMDVVLPKEYKLFRCPGLETHIAFFDEEQNYVVNDILVGFRKWLKAHNPLLNVLAPRFVDEVIPVIHNKALWESDHAIEKYTRMAMYRNKLIYNLNGGCSAVIESGEYKLVSNYDLLDEDFAFFKNKSMGNQNLPLQSNGSYMKNLGKFLSMDEAESCLLSVLLISFFNPNIKKPLVCLSSLNNYGKAILNYVFQILIDPLSDMGIYLPIYGGIEFLEERYLYSVTGLGTITEMAASMSNPKFGPGVWDSCMSKCYIVNNLSKSTLTPAFKKRIVSFESNMVGSNFDDFSQFKESFDKMVPYLLDEIFKVLGKALEYYEPFIGKPKKELEEYFNWASCISYALYGNGETFSEVIAGKKP